MDKGKECHQTVLANVFNGTTTFTDQFWFSVLHGSILSFEKDELLDIPHLLRFYNFLCRLKRNKYPRKTKLEL